MNIEQAQALAMICHYAKEYLKDNKTMSQSVDIAKDIIERELKDKEELAQALSITACENGDLLKYKQALEIIKEHTMYLENVNSFVFIDMSNKDIDLLKEILL